MTGDDMARQLIEAHLAGTGHAADRIVVDQAAALVAAPLANMRQQWADEQQAGRLRALFGPAR